MTGSLTSDTETWALDGITFGATTDGVFYVVDQVTGWDTAPPRRTRRTDRPGTLGSFRSPNYQGERVYTLAGWAVVGTEAAALAVRDRLTQLCADPGALYPLRHIDTLSGEDRTAYVELDDALVAIAYGEEPLRVDFSLQLGAVDPRKHGPFITSSAGLPTDPVGGLDATAPGLNATAPGLDAGTPGNLGLISATNTGTAPTYPLITFTANSDGLMSPSLTATDTGESIGYTGLIPAGSVVYINTDSFPFLGFPERSVLLGGTADRGNFLKILGDWPVIKPGQTKTFAFRSDSVGNTTSQVGLTLRPAYW